MGESMVGHHGGSWVSHCGGSRVGHCGRIQGWLLWGDLR